MKVKTETREYGNLLLKIVSDSEGSHYTLASEKHCLLDFLIARKGWRYDIPQKKAAP